MITLAARFAEWVVFRWNRNGTEDHVHLLAKFRPDSALSDVLRDSPANASGRMHDLLSESKDFTVEGFLLGNPGYGVFNQTAQRTGSLSGIFFNAGLPPHSAESLWLSVHRPPAFIS